jgi:hypothetical protein
MNGIPLFFNFSLCKKYYLSGASGMLGKRLFLNY